MGFVRHGRVLHQRRALLFRRRTKSCSQRHAVDRSSDLFAEVDEFTDFELEFPSGAVAVCRTSFGERMDFLEITCEQGSYKLEPFQGYTGVSGSASDGAQFNQTIENQQAKQMDDDALALIEGRTPLVPGEEGMRDVRIIQAIVAAAQTGQPVELT